MTRFRFVAPLIALALVLVACTSGPPAGTKITVTSLWGGSEEEAFQKVLDAFKAETGIEAVYEPQRDDYAAVLRTRIAGGNPPDVAIIPGIGYLRGLVRDGLVKKMSDLGINKADLEANYAPGILDVGAVDGEFYALMVKLNSKSTIWYRPNALSQMGTSAPTSWDELLQLTAAFKDAGETPWAIGAKDGWTLTDWFESIYLRQAGPENYDKLFSGQLAWTDQSVKDAIDRMLEIINDANVDGGISGALGTGFVDGIGKVFSANPTAEMYYEGGFVGGIALGQVNESLVVGTDIDFFDFPPIGGSGAGNVTIGGDVIAAFTTNPGVKEFINFMASQKAGEVWAGTGAIVSPVKSVSEASYPNDLAKKEAAQVANATAVRFDGSDLLPGGPDLGAVLQGAIQGEDVDTLLSDFDTAVTKAWADERG